MQNETKTGTARVEQARRVQNKLEETARTAEACTHWMTETERRLKRACGAAEEATEAAGTGGTRHFETEAAKTAEAARSAAAAADEALRHAAAVKLAAVDAAAEAEAAAAGPGGAKRSAAAPRPNAGIRQALKACGRVLEPRAGRGGDGPGCASSNRDALAKIYAALNALSEDEAEPSGLDGGVTEGLVRSALSGAVDALEPYTAELEDGTAAEAGTGASVADAYEAACRALSAIRAAARKPMRRSAQRARDPEYVPGRTGWNAGEGVDTGDNAPAGG